MAHQVRDTSGFAPASHQSQALCLGTLGTAALLAPVTQWGFEPPRLLAAWAVAAGGAWLLTRARRHWRLHERESGGLTELMSISPAADPALFPHGHLHPDIARLIKVAEQKFPGKVIALEPSAVEFGDDGQGGKRLVAWGFRCVVGALSVDKFRSELQTAFGKSVQGRWRFSFNALDDVFTATQKDPVPPLVFPPHWPVVSSSEEARKKYLGWTLCYGESADKRQVRIRPDKIPHIKVVGETGSGKSVMVRSLIEQCRAAGWMLILADGKGMDYVGYVTPNPEDHNLPVPGTVAVGSGSGTGMNYVAAITLAYQILMERQTVGESYKSADPSTWSTRFPPVLLVLDEIKSMRDRWGSELSKEDFEKIGSMIIQILNLGRELRVHALLVSQDAYVDSLPSRWMTNTKVSVVAGKPDQNAVGKFFDRSVVPKVKLIGETMDPNVKGRCLVASIDEDSGKSDVVEFQSYLGYSPGESWDDPKFPAEVRAAWPAFKKEVSDRIPRLYSRFWFEIPHKSEAQLEHEQEIGEELGYIDFDRFSVSEIKKLKRIKLDMRDENGDIVPNPKYAKYDPCSPLYVCRPPEGAARSAYVDPEI